LEEDEMTKRSFTIEAKAHALISPVLALGQSKAALGTLVRHVIVSVGTLRSFQQCLLEFLRWRVDKGTGIDAPVIRAELDEYLLQESARWRQKTVDQHRQALSLIFCVMLTHFEAEVPTITAGRAYSQQEMELIASRQALQNALGTRLAFRAGLRAAELYELREADELQREANRPWRSDLFAGLSDGVVYRTVGKGGLARSVWIPQELHRELQTRRLKTPVMIIDRKVRRVVHFKIGGGQSLSQSFSSTSGLVLGFSNGIHGCRHGYAQSRLETLLEMGFMPIDCLEIISQEMGHLRCDISLVYTTKRK
jgi:integrase